MELKRFIGYSLTSLYSFVLAEPLLTPIELQSLKYMLIAGGVATLNQAIWSRLREPLPKWQTTVGESVLTGFIAGGLVGLGTDFLPKVNIGMVAFAGVLIGGLGPTIALKAMRSIAAKFVKGVDNASN